MKIRIEKIGCIFTVYVDDLVHLRFDLQRIIAHQACIDETKKGTMYYIEWYLDTGQVIKSSYNQRDLWEAVLNGLERE